MIGVDLAALLIVAGVALFVAAPLAESGRRRQRESFAERELDRLEHERALAVQGLRELRFDREMGKIGEADAQALGADLEARAIAALQGIARMRQPGAPLGRPAGAPAANGGQARAPGTAEAVAGFGKPQSGRVLAGRLQAAPEAALRDAAAGTDSAGGRALGPATAEPRETTANGAESEPGSAAGAAAGPSASSRERG